MRTYRKIKSESELNEEQTGGEIPVLDSVPKNYFRVEKKWRRGSPAAQQGYHMPTFHLFTHAKPKRRKPHTRRIR